MVKDLLKEKIDNDPFLIQLDSGLIQHKKHPRRVTARVIDHNLILEEIAWIVEQLDKAHLKISQIEDEALSRIIRVHLFENEISYQKSQNLAILLKHIMMHNNLFDIEMGGMVNILKAIRAEGGDKA